MQYYTLGTLEPNEFSLLFGLQISIIHAPILRMETGIVPRSVGAVAVLAYHSSTSSPSRLIPVRGVEASCFQPCQRHVIVHSYNSKTYPDKVEWTQR